MYKFTFPFEPPWEDCRMTHVTKSGTKVHIFDTCCKNQTPEEKMRIDTAIVKWYNDSVHNQAIRDREALEALEKLEPIEGRIGIGLFSKEESG